MLDTHRKVILELRGAVFEYVTLCTAGAVVKDVLGEGEVTVFYLGALGYDFVVPGGYEGGGVPRETTGAENGQSQARTDVRELGSRVAGVSVDRPEVDHPKPAVFREIFEFRGIPEIPLVCGVEAVQICGELLLGKLRKILIFQGKTLQPLELNFPLVNIHIQPHEGNFPFNLAFSAAKEALVVREDAVVAVQGTAGHKITFLNEPIFIPFLLQHLPIVAVLALDAPHIPFLPHLKIVLAILY